MNSITELNYTFIKPGDTILDVFGNKHTVQEVGFDHPRGVLLVETIPVPYISTTNGCWFNVNLAQLSVPQKTKAEIIDETVEFYTIHPRSLNDDRRCLYKGPNGAECAFQRVVKTDLSGNEGQSASSVIDSVEFKPGYGGHDIRFWNDIQSLHDSSCFWNREGGLSELGKQKVYSLKEYYTLLQ